MAYTAKIGGVAVNVIAGTLHLEQQIGQRSIGSIGVWSVLGLVYQYGTQVQIYDDSSTLVYAGYTIKDKVSKSGAPQGTGVLEHTIQLMDNCYRADKRRVFQTYLGVSADFIVKDLFNRYLAVEGVTITASSIAVGPTITEVIWSGTKSVTEALTWLCTQSGYWWLIDKNAVLWFQPYGAISAPIILDGSTVDAVQELTAEFGNDQYVNKQYAKGGFGEIKAQVNNFTANGVETQFVCSYPLASSVTVTVNGVPYTGASLGTKGVDNGKPFYWAVGDAVVAQDPNAAPLANGTSVTVSYNGRFPVIAAAQNSALITAQQTREGGVGTGLVESTYVNLKVHTLPAAFQIAGALLDHFGHDMTVLTFSTRLSGFVPGQMLSVLLTDFNLTGPLSLPVQMLISGVLIDDQGPDPFVVWYRVTAIGSPIEAAQYQTYWQNLMNQSSDPSDLADVADTALALLTTTVAARTPTATVTIITTVCPICNTGTLCNTTTIVC